MNECIERSLSQKKRDRDAEAEEEVEATAKGRKWSKIYWTKENVKQMDNKQRTNCQQLCATNQRLYECITSDMTSLSFILPFSPSLWLSIAHSLSQYLSLSVASSLNSEFYFILKYSSNKILNLQRTQNCLTLSIPAKNAAKMKCIFSSDFFLFLPIPHSPSHPPLFHFPFLVCVTLYRHLYHFHPKQKLRTLLFQRHTFQWPIRILFFCSGFGCR